MGREILTSMVTVLTAIIAVAIVATLVSNRAQTATVIGAASTGFARDLQTALSPVTGASSSGLSDLSFTGGGVGYMG
jgi:hypothetical protein